MKISYKIIEVHPNDHLIVVRFFTDVVSEAMLASSSQKNKDGTPVRCRSDVAINVPIPTPSDADLGVLIMANAPIDALKRLEQIQDPEIDTSMSSLLSLKGKTTTKEVDDPDPTISTITEEELAEIISSITPVAEKVVISNTELNDAVVKTP